MLTLIATLFSIVLLGIFARRHFSGARAAVLCVALFVTMPMVWLGARGQAPQIVLLPFVIAWLAAFDEYFRSGRPEWLAVGGAALAIPIYVHLAGVVMAPAYFAIAVFALVARREPLGRIAVCIAAFAVVALPWVIMTMSDPGPFEVAIQRYGLYDASRFNILQGAREITSWVGLTVRSEVFWDCFNPALLFLGKGGLANSLLRPEVFLLPFAVPFVRGLMHMLKRPPSATDGIVLAAFVAAPLAAALIAQPPVPARLILMAPVAAVIATRGFTRLA